MQAQTTTTVANSASTTSPSPPNASLPVRPGRLRLHPTLVTLATSSSNSQTHTDRQSAASREAEATARAAHAIRLAQLNSTLAAAPEHHDLFKTSLTG
mmetsp:Transcript_1207/g.3755  ORF Transcript_1207/g.3755 Transcript_1207/m.3755 type:complete len:98 (-) Transcript_1207:2181-2474(-)